MKEVFKIALMHVTSGMHLGYGTGEEYDRSSTILYSDTLSAALCSVHAKSGGEVPSFLDSFRVSSAMPVYKGRFFLPLPPDKQCIHMQESASAHKQLKRLSWIELPLWEKLSLNGELTITRQMISDCGTAIVQDSGKGVVIMRSFVEQKVTVSHTSEDAMPYFFDKVYFGPDVSLYVMYQCDNDVTFCKSFELLADAGIGTSRSVGNGGFEVEFGQVEVEVHPEVDSRQLLSMWIPRQEECTPEIMSRSCYKMLIRGGYMAGAQNPSHRHLLKNNVYMIESGSIIVAPKLQGKIVDLKPEHVASHSVWRDGRAFYLPFKMIDTDEV